MAARGMWMHLICIAHAGSPHGHVTINGRPPTPRQLAAIVGATEAEVTGWLAELEAAGVFSRTHKSGVIYSRRMVADDELIDAGIKGAAERWGTGVISGTTRSERLAAARKLGTHTAEEWAALLAFCGTEKCLRCGLRMPAATEIVASHIVPIYQGGSDAISNLQPLCRVCSDKKGRENIDFRPDGWNVAVAKNAWGNAWGGEASEGVKMPAQKREERREKIDKKDLLSEVEKSAPVEPARQPQKRRERISPHWQPSPADLLFASIRRINPDEDTVAAFVLHHTNSEKLMLDYSAAWRTWILRSLKFHPPPPPTAEELEEQRQMTETLAQLNHPPKKHRT